MIKKLAALLLTAATLFTTSISVPAAEDISVYTDGTRIEFDQPPVIKNDRVLVPLRAIFEALEATVDWDGDTQTVTAQSGETVITLKIGEPVLNVGDKSVTLDVAPEIIGDRTLVPIRAISEALYATVDWDGENRVVTITTGDRVDYTQKENWVYFADGDNKKSDVFIVAPTVYFGTYLSLDDEETKESFVGALNMERGIYDESGRLYAPFYRQVGFDVYELPKEEQEEYLEKAYKDVKDAFLYYFENENNGRPYILAGFSQGADHVLRLIKDLFGDEKYTENFVAAYPIGWIYTEDEVLAYPQLKPAQGETDTGVIITFNSEAEDVTSSLIVGENEKTYAINPLNWKTDSTPADKSLNLGAAFTDYSGNIKEEIPELTGAYLDSARGTLKVTDVSPEDYPPAFDIFEEGVYHVYDYQFFYRNLQNNVNKRVDAFIENGGNIKSYADYQDVDWTEHTIKLPTGINLAYTVTGPEDGTPVVLIHGLTDGRVSWSQVAPKLAEKGYRVYVPEYRGNGKTDKPTEESAYSVEELTKDIAAFLDELNIDKAHIVGHSLGSFIAQELNISYKDKVGSITLIGTGVSIDTDSETMDWFINGDGEEFAGIFGYEDTEKLPESFIEAWGYSTNPDPDFQAANLAHLRQTPTYVWKALTSNLLEYDNTDRLKDITGDVQIIWGSEDGVFSREQQELLKNGLANSNVTFHEIEGVDHNTHWGSWEAVDTVVDYIDSFIKE